MLVYLEKCSFPLSNNRETLDKLKNLDEKFSIYDKRFYSPKNKQSTAKIKH